MVMLSGHASYTSGNSRWHSPYANLQNSGMAATPCHDHPFLVATCVSCSSDSSKSLKLDFPGWIEGYKSNVSSVTVFSPKKFTTGHKGMIAPPRTNTLRALEGCEEVHEVSKNH